MFIPIIVSATRPESNGLKVGKALSNLLKQAYPEIETTLVSPNDFHFDFDSNEHHDPKFTELTTKANAFVFVVSEYNHSFPGRFKTLLDSEFKNYSGKFALIAGVSNGVFGGVRAIESILPVLRSLDIRTIRKDIPFIQAQNLVDDNGNFLNEDIKTRSTEALEHFVKVIQQA
jgi:NAD(P)H-dependent FMN reductase